MQLVLLVALCVGLGGAVSMSPAAERKSNSAGSISGNAVLEKISALEKVVQHLEATIASQDHTIESQRMMITQTRMKTTEELNRKSNVQDEVHRELLKKIETLEKTVEETERKYPGIRDVVKNVDACAEKSLQHGSTGDIAAAVAFSAYSTTGGNFYYNTAQIINFEGVEYNSGTYDPALSVFDCPVTGLYWFSIDLDFYFTGSASYTYYAEVNLVKGTPSAIIATVYEYNRGGTYKQSSNSIITMCTVGERVYAEAAREVYVNGVVRRSTFSGLLLAE